MTSECKERRERNSAVQDSFEVKMRKLLILGAGGMGRMVEETALQLGYDDIAFLDDAKKEKDVIGKCCDYGEFLKSYDSAVAAFGDNNMRLLWTERLMEAGYQVPALVHPSAIEIGRASCRERV